MWSVDFEHWLDPAGYRRRGQVEITCDLSDALAVIEHQRDRADLELIREPRTIEDDGQRPRPTLRSGMRLGYPSLTRRA